MNQMQIRVSIVEDNLRLRGSLVKLIELSEGFQCASQHATAEAGLAELPRIKPDVILMDINLPGKNGVDCVRELKPLLPATQIVMFTVYENTDLIFKALAAGASGYLVKQTPPAELLAALRDVFNGGSPMTSHIARKVVASFRQTDAASRELAQLTPASSRFWTIWPRAFSTKRLPTP